MTLDFRMLAAAFGAAEEEDLLVTHYGQMAEEGPRFFEEYRKMGALSDNTQMIAAAFKVEWVGDEVAKMSRKVEGDVKRAEVV